MNLGMYASIPLAPFRFARLSPEKRQLLRRNSRTCFLARLSNRVQTDNNMVLPIGTNSADPGDYPIGSLESRVAARALAEQRRKRQGCIALIWPGPKPEWFPADHGKHRWQHGPFEIFCEDDPDYPAQKVRP